MSFFSKHLLRGKTEAPVQAEPPKPIQEAKPTSMQQIIRSGRADLGDRAHPEEMAAYIQASATLRLAAELAALREVLENGSGGITVGVEHAGASDGPRG